VAGGKFSSYLAKAKIVLPANPLPSPNLDGGAIVARFDGSPGVTYTIEYTENLLPANWQKLTDLAAPSANQGLGVGVFELRDNATGGSRYYRTVWPPY